MESLDPGRALGAVSEVVRRYSDRIELATLFGSLVRGVWTPMSDVDVGVYPRDGGLDERLEVSFEVARSASEAFGVPEDRVDVVFLDEDLPIELLFDAVCRGVLAYCEDEAFYWEFRDRVTSEYLDFRVFRERLRLYETYAEALRRRVEQWGR